ncbi:tRNA-dihydrouridine synthase, partial [bacterium]|nr:tRNA-dihydrouridine synthase [bacterium]
MRIGTITLDTPLVLAPLAGLTDSAMRRLCRRMGASMVWTEMASVEGAIRDSWKTIDLLAFAEEERPIAFQLFGSRPESMAEATRRVVPLRPDAIDINAGCPVKRIVKSTSGAALMRDLPLLRDVVQAVLESTELPVTVKLRSGWDQDSINAPEAAGM